MLSFLLADHQEVKILRTVVGDLPRPQGLTISIARSPDEFIAATKLVYESFQRRGIPFTDKSEMRILPQIMSANTAVIVAKLGETVIGTATILTRNPFGFFLSEMLNENEQLDLFKDGHSAFAELASLAIDAKYLAPASSLFYDLIAYSYQYSKNYLKVQTLMTAAQPGVTAFYRTLFGFEPMVKSKPRPMRSLGDALHIPMAVTLEKFEKKIEKNVKRMSSLKKIGDYILRGSALDTALQFPEEKLSNGMYSLKTVSALEELFMKKTQMMVSVPADVRARLAAQYPTTDDYLWVFQNDPRIKKRRSRRFSVDLPTSIAVRSDGNGMSIRNGRILDISENGIRLELMPSQAALPTAGEITVTIPVSDTTETSVHGEIVRSDVDQRSYGIQITDCSRSFLDYIRGLAAADNLKSADTVKSA